MKVIIDAQLPPALARLFAAHGFDAVHVEDLGMKHAGDSAIWNVAAAEGPAVVTKDSDFPERWERGNRSVPVVWIRCGNIRNRLLFVQITPLLSQIAERLSRGETLIEIW